MKKIQFFFNYLLIATLLTAIGSSCQDKITITDIKLDKDELLFSVGGTTILTASLRPFSASDKMQWSIDNSNVAVVECNDKAGSVSKANVTAKGIGMAVITVSTKDGNHIAKCTVIVINPEPEMVLVEGGTFTMGCTDGDCLENSGEEPAHQVTLSSYKIAKYAVTQQQWEAVMGDRPSIFRGQDLPVENITWHQVQEFIKKLNVATGKNYRLPTEAEWEYAARGGNKSKGYQYSGSNNINDVAWYSANSGRTTHPVGTKAPNELDVYDMSGNILEWCNDRFGDYTEISQTNPQGSDSGSLRVVRGGTAIDGAYYCRVSFRFGFSPDAKGGVGFRLAHP